MGLGRVWGALGALVVLGGCSEPFWTSNVRETMSLPTSGVIATNADVRLVHRFRGQEVVPAVNPDGTIKNDGTGRQAMEIRPREYLCAEPSPDVARAVQAALSTSGSAAGTATPPAGGTAIEAQLAFQTNASRSESVAQLTKRIATIQLLRDGLYRACEAYANGAIGQEMYTAIVSRYDRMMITMLLAEMAVGNFGSAAILSGNSSAEGSADASAGPGGRAAVAQVQYQKAKDDYEAQVKVVEELRVRKAQAQGRADAKKAAGQDNSSDLTEVAELDAKIAGEEKIQAVREADVKTADAARTDAKKADAQAQAFASARGKTSASSGGQIVDSPARAAKETAEVLARMQRTYINEPQGHALLLMCFSEMASWQPIRSGMRDTCSNLFAATASPAVQGQHWDATVRQQLQELDNDRINALAAKLTPQQSAALLTKMLQNQNAPTGLPNRPRDWNSALPHPAPVNR